MHKFFTANFIHIHMSFLRRALNTHIFDLAVVVDLKNVNHSTDWYARGSCSRVPAGVEGEVVAAREPAAAVGALEGLGAGVLAVVAGELVGAGEAPLASLPRARVRLLTWERRKFQLILLFKFNMVMLMKWMSTPVVRNELADRHCTMSECCL